MQGAHERVHVVQPLAGEDAFVEEVLIRVGNGGGIGIDARVARVEPGEQRPGAAGHRDAHPRLQDRVALRDSLRDGVETRAVQRVRDDADERPRGVSRKARVGVERDAVAHAWQNRQVAHLRGERRLAIASQQAIELFDFSALALPAHPDALARVPAAFTMEQEEPIRVPAAEPAIQLQDAVARGRQDRLVAVALGRLRVAKIAQDGEVNAGVEVAVGQHFHVLEERHDAIRARDQCRHDHHRARVVRHAFGQIEPREPPRRDRPRDQPLHERAGDIERRDDEQRHRQEDQRQRRAVAAEPDDDGPNQTCREARDRSEIAQRAVPAAHPPQARAEPEPARDVQLEVVAPSADEVVADVRRRVGGRAARGGLARVLNRLQRQVHLRLSRGVGNLLDRLALLVAAQEIHAAIHAGRIAPQGVFDEAHVLEVLAPVQLGTEPEAVDGVAHRHLQHALALMLAADRVLGRHLLGLEVRHDRLVEIRRAAPILARPQEQLHDRRVRDAVRPYRPAVRVAVQQVIVRALPRSPRRHDLVGQPADIFNQGQRQHARPRPQLADRQRRDALIAVEKRLELLPIEPAVAVPDELDRHRVHARLAPLLAGRERRQLPRVRRREIAPDVHDLRRQEVEVVEQPFRRGGDEHAGSHVAREREVGAAEHARVVREAGEDASRPHPWCDDEPRRELQRAVFETLRADELVTEWAIGDW